MKTTELLPFLLPELPGAPQPIVLQALVQEAIAFCTESHAWQEIQEPIIVIDKIAELDVETPTDARIVAVKDIWGINRKLRPVTMDQLFELIPNWQVAEGSEPVYYNASTDWQTIRIFPKPIGANRSTLTMRVAYAPTISATTLPDELCTKYLDGLTSGTKARLMLMPGKTWSNPQMGAYYRALFNEQILKAKIDKLHDGVEGSLSVKPHPFA